MKNNTITADEFDRIFDEGKEDIVQYLDLDSARRSVKIDFPFWMVEAMDKEALRMGVSFQALVKFIISTHLEGRK